LGIFSTEDNQNAVYRKDNVGRNIQVVDTVQNYHIMELSPYWVEELIYDHQNKSRVSFDFLVDNYLPKKDFKQVFTINNKLIVQNDNIFKIFSMKNVDDCSRLLNLIKETFINDGRTDCLFVPDSSTVQRKELYNLLEENGFDRKFLYKQYTY
tara:strand:+ start:1578 stop:2036 length:459 start_codon:yes stop_codon:yes gene_type:complete